MALGAEVPPVQRSLRVRGDTIEATGGEHVRASLGAGLEVHGPAGAHLAVQPGRGSRGVRGRGRRRDAGGSQRARRRGDDVVLNAAPIHAGRGMGFGTRRGDTRRYAGRESGHPDERQRGERRDGRWRNSRGRPRVAHVRGAHVRGGLRRRRRAGLQESAVRRRAARHRGEGDDRSRVRILRRRDAILRRCFEQIREARQARAASPEGRGTKAERLPGRRRRGFKAQGGDGSLIIPRGCGG